MVSLVIGFLFDPPSRVVPQDPFANLVEDEDDNGEGQPRNPPVDLQRVHFQTLVHARGVGQDGGQAGLEEEAKVEHLKMVLLL